MDFWLTQANHGPGRLSLLPSVGQ